MALRTQGRVTEILALEKGEKNGKTWQKRGFITETFGDFPQLNYWSGFGDKIVTEINKLKVDDLVTIQFTIQSREYNGKWYTTNNVVRIEKMGASLPTGTVETVDSSQLPPPPPKSDEKSEEDNDVLPF